MEIGFGEMMEISSFECGDDFTHIGCILEMCSLILCVHGVYVWSLILCVHGVCVWALVPRYMHGGQRTSWQSHSLLPPLNDF